MKFFVVTHKDTGDEYRSFIGMNEETVKMLIAEYGAPSEFIDEQTFNTEVEKQRKKD